MSITSLCQNFSPSDTCNCRVPNSLPSFILLMASWSSDLMFCRDYFQCLDSWMLEHYSWFICTAVVSPSLIISSFHHRENKSIILLRIRRGQGEILFSCQRCIDYKAGEEDCDELIGLQEETRFGSTLTCLNFELEYILENPSLFGKVTKVLVILLLTFAPYF